MPIANEVSAIEEVDLQKRGRGWGLAAISAGMFMITMDGAALNLALPAIQREMNGTVSQLEWVVTAYTIPLAGLLLTTGALGDRWGARRLFIGALLAFALTSMLCAMSSSLSLLIAFRILQGIAAAGLLPVVFSLVAKGYEDKIERARAVNTLAIVGGIAMVIGPFGGGMMTQVFGWRSIFLINIPIGFLAAFIAQMYVRETARRAAPLDVPGLIVGIVALTAMVGGLIETSSLGRTHPLVIGLVAAGVAGVGVFLRIEGRAPHPMLPLAVFRNKPFTAAAIGGFAFQFGFYGMLFMLALFVQIQWGIDPLHAGMMLLPAAVSVILTTTVLNPMLLHHGPRRMLCTGGAIATIGSVAIMAVSTPDSWLLFEIGTVLVGIGASVFSPSLNVVATTTIEPAYAGLAAGIYNTSRQIGMAVSIAILGALVDGEALLGLRIGLLLIAGCFAAIVALALRYI